MKNSVILGVVFLSLLLGIGKIRASDCHIPIFAKQLTPTPNVLFIIDNSGSMNQILEATVENGYFGWSDTSCYNPDRSYRGDYTNKWRFYMVSEDRWYNIGRRGGRPVWAFLVRNVYPGGWQHGRYYGNYLNWIQNFANVRVSPGGPGNPPRGDFMIDLPRVNNSWRGIPRYLEDITDSRGTPFLDPVKLSKPYKYVPGPNPPTVYDYWRRMAACRDSVVKFVACMSLDPELYGGKPYPIPLRFGLMNFNTGGSAHEGGVVNVPCKDLTPAHLADLDRRVRAEPPVTWTPLAETLYDAYDYFREPSTSPIQAWCQLNFIVYLTDGESTQDLGYSGAPLWEIGNYDQDDINELDPLDRHSGHVGERCDRKEPNFYILNGTDYLDDVAYFIRWKKGKKRVEDADIRPDMERNQYLITYTIGAYIDYCLLKETADHGDGLYFPAKDGERLKEAFSQIVGDIIRRAQAGGAVAPTLGLARQIEEEDRLIRAYFHPSGWRGYMECYTVDKNRIDTANPFWQAHYKLSDWEKRPPIGQGAAVGENNDARNARQIFTTRDGKTRIDFDVDDASTIGLSANVIRYIRGYEVPGFRNRVFPDERTPLDDKDTVTWRLGHIVHSTPQLVGPPKAPYLEKSYLKFRKEYGLGGRNEREIMVYVGANDGMLHAFRLGKDKADDNRGKEEWAYIPGNLLSKLHLLTEDTFSFCPKYYVDLSPTVADIVDPSDHLKYRFNRLRGRWEYGSDDEGLYKDWRTYLIGGQRVGGKNYFCLDITEVGAKGKSPKYTNFKLKWDQTYPHLGQTWSEPQIKPILWDWNPGAGKDDIDTKPKWVVIFGSGYDNDTTDSQAYLFIVDVVSGRLLTDEGPIKIKDDNPNVKGITPLGSVAAYDVNWDGVIDKIYFGDAAGNLWKVQVDTPTMNVGSSGLIDDEKYWKVDCLFRTKPNQPITAPPVLTYTSDYNLMILFGTGMYHKDADIRDMSDQSFYAIIDRDQSPEIDYNVEEVKISDLANQTDPNNIQSMVGKKGWYIDLLSGYRSWDVGDPHLDGERVTNRAALEGKVVVFTSFAPVNKICEAGGVGYVYALYYMTGTPPGLYARRVLTGGLNPADSEAIFYSGDSYDFAKNKVIPLMDINKDGKVDDRDLIAGNAPRSQGLGPGIPSKPVVDFKHEAINIQTSDAEIRSVVYRPITELIEIRSWRKLR